ncbi:MAG TPA: site-2 protease family protein [Marmoricola sp.]
MPSPVFLGLLALTIASGVLTTYAPSGSRMARVEVFVFILAAWLVSVCLHEFAHAYVALRGGDAAVVEAGYLRLNPFRYVHPLLSVVLPLVWITYGGIGLPGGAVMVHSHRLRSRAWVSAVSAAGPVTNIAVALVSLGALRLFGASPTGSGFVLYAAIGWFAWLQISVAILNLLPIPGLDGWGIIEPWVSSDTARSAAKIKPFGLLVLVLFLWIPTLSVAFGNLVDTVAYALGEPDGLASVGAELFKFWAR